MNIFVTSENPKEAAINLDDVRVNKMIVESVQMLITAMKLNGEPESALPLSKSGKPYRPTHMHHPCTQWVSSNRSNYSWLLDHLIALLDEYTYRTGKGHFCKSTLSKLIPGMYAVPQGPLEGFVNCTLYKDEHTPGWTIFDRYQVTLVAKWKCDKVKVKWTNRDAPSWYKGPTHKIGNITYRS